MDTQQVHRCHAEGCEQAVPPRLFACSSHWWALTAYHRNRIWQTYRADQEITKDPSPQYRIAAAEAVEYLAKKEGRR